ncbi:hypothetical protein RUM44_007279 [Polyplax serrata]|uniref:Uncharacterized protein n=1 Tax=Polyplax serrata TaxID=468196 RepID=A0ABR1B092_POLSC
MRGKEPGKIFGKKKTWRYEVTGSGENDGCVRAHVGVVATSGVDTCRFICHETRSYLTPFLLEKKGPCRGFLWLEEVGLRRRDESAVKGKAPGRGRQEESNRRIRDSHQ